MRRWSCFPSFRPITFRSATHSAKHETPLLGHASNCSSSSSQCTNSPEVTSCILGTSATNVAVKKKGSKQIKNSCAIDEDSEDLSTLKRVRKVRAKKHWSFPLPSKLQNKRLLTTIMVAYYLALFLEGIDPATWRTLAFLNSDNEKHQNEAISFAEYHVKPFAQLLPNHLQNEVNNLKALFPFLNEQHISYCDNSGTFQFSCQFHVFHQNTGTLLASIPEKYDSTKRQLYFSATSDPSGEIRNIAIIQNLLSFFRLFGLFCFFCGKFFRGHGTQHKCKKTQTCFACRRPLLNRDTYITLQTRSLFCNASLSANESQECSKCHLRILTLDCKKFHDQKVCRWGILCKECNKYIFLNKFTQKEKLLASHVCGTHQCFFCGLSEKKQDHVCKIKLPTFDSNFTNLGFLNLEFTGHDLTNCEECYKKKSVCKFCADNETREAILCEVSVETEKPEHFKRYTFFSFQTEPLKEEVRHFEYWPKSMAPKNLAARTKTKFGKATKNMKQTFF